MSDPTHLTLELQRDLEDAAELLARAGRTLRELLGDDAGWPLMEDVGVSIDLQEQRLRRLLGTPALAEAFAGARAAMDEAPDHADRLP